MPSRTLLALLCVPLAAFSCATTSRMFVKAAQTPAIPTSAFLVQQFDSATMAVSGWGSEKGYKESQCNRDTATPFCKAFTSKYATVEVRLEPFNNQVEVIFLINSSTEHSNDTLSLKSALSKSGDWIVEMRGPKWAR